HADALPVMRLTLLATLLIAVAPITGRADDLLGEASRSETALEARVHAAVVRALDGDPRNAVRELEVLDYERSLQGQRPSGLTDDMRLLAAGGEPRRDAPRVARRRALPRGAAPARPPRRRAAPGRGRRAAPRRPSRRPARGARQRPGSR